jgi:hypothetical protein
MEKIAASVAGESRINNPQILDRLTAVARLGESLAGSAAEVPTADLFGHLFALKGIMERHPLADIDPDSDEPIGEALRAHDGLGNIKLALDKAIGAARLAGFKAPPGEDDEKLKSVPRSQLGTKAIAENVEQLDRVNADLEALRSAAHEDAPEHAHEETPSGDLPREMVDNFADRVEVKVGLAKLELANESDIDVGAVRRHVEDIDALATVFSQTAAAMRRVLARRVQEAAGALKRSADVAVTMVRRLVSLLRGGKRPPRPGDLIHDAPFAPQLVVVPAGSFMMGSPVSEKDRLNSEGPQHLVTIGSPFAVGRFAVTFDEWDEAYRRGGVEHNPGDEGWGPGAVAGDQCVMGGCPSLCGLDVAGDRQELPAALGSGVGVLRKGGDRGALLVGGTDLHRQGQLRWQLHIRE